MKGDNSMIEEYKEIRQDLINICKELDQSRYIAEEGMRDILSAIGNKIMSIIDRMISFIQKKFLKYTDRDKLDNMVHVKMFQQFKVGQNETKLVYDRITKKYDIITDFAKVSEELENLREIWRRTARIMTTHKMNDYHERFWKMIPNREAQAIKDILVRSLQDIKRIVQKTDADEMQVNGDDIAKVLNDIQYINTLILQCYDSMLYVNRTTENIQTKGDVTAATYGNIDPSMVFV